MYDAGSMNLRSLKIFIAVFEAENFFRGRAPRGPFRLAGFAHYPPA